MKFEYNDGGRKAAGRKGDAGDCVCRAIVIATGLPYLQVYETLAKGNAGQRRSKHTPKQARTASNGINVGRKWFREYMTSLGFTWVPTMQIGSGCKVHLRSEELPKGRLVVTVSKHWTAVIDGVINDIYNPDRGGDRCVYGYWMLKDQTPMQQTQDELKKEFIMQLFSRITKKLTLFEQAVLQAMYQPTPDIDGVLSSLKDQQRDNSAIVGMIGEDLGKLLQKIIL